MSIIRSDSPLARRIVQAILEFLNSVEMAPGADPEAVEVARDCLQDAFNVNLSSPDERIKPGFLVNLFRSAETGGDNQYGSTLLSASRDKKCQASSSSKEPEGYKSTYNSNDAESSGVSDSLGVVSRDELFGRFYAALDKIGFFTSLPGGLEDPAKTAKAKDFFDEAVTVLESSNSHKMDSSNLAEVLKEKGNETMRLNKYSEAIDLYTCSIAIKEKAVYYCNRAAAYTKVGKYAEAIEDCLKSINIDPNYSKGYSRLGSAYFALGQYRNALEQGYLRALQLDPNNSTIQENIQVTQQRLLEQHRHGESDQNRRPHQPNEPNTQSAGPANFNFPFPMGTPTPDMFTNILRNMTSVHSEASGAQTAQATGAVPNNVNFEPFPLNVSDIPVDLANVLGNMASTLQVPRDHNMNVEHPNEPEVNVGANVNINFGEGSEQVSDILRTVMGMFSSQNASQGSTPHGTNESDTNGR